MTPKTVKTGNRKHLPATFDECLDAKAYGLAHGYKGDLGGWIYKDGQHIAHGWGQFYHLIGGLSIEQWKTKQAQAKESK
jgi:hypothetical protein